MIATIQIQNDQLLRRATQLTNTNTPSQLVQPNTETNERKKKK